MASYYNLRIGQDSDFADNVKIDHALNFSMPKKVFSKNFTNIELKGPTYVGSSNIAVPSIYKEVPE